MNIIFIYSYEYMNIIFILYIHNLNGINTKHKLAEKNTGQCFSIELQFTCKNISDKCEQNRKTS